jgi:hypothetical protein
MNTKQARIRFLPVMMFFILLSIAITGYPERIDDHSTHYHMKNHFIQMESETFVVNLNPATLETILIRKDQPNDKITVSQAVFHKKTFDINLDDQSILYPRDDFRITFHLDEKMLKVTFSSQKPQTIPWPSVSMKKESTSLIWPHFEGNYIPLDDTIWTDYLKSREWNTTEHQYMPFWGVERGKQLLSYLLENPFHNTITFTEKKSDLHMDFLSFTAGSQILYSWGFSSCHYMQCQI